MMRAPGWGPRRAEQNLLAFLSEARTSQLSWTDRGGEFAALDAWLEDATTPHALVLGPPGIGKSALLSRWADRQIERGGAEVVYLPVSRRFGLALARDVLGVLYARVQPPTIRPSGMAEMRVAIRGQLECERASEEPPVILIIDGAEEPVDFAIDGALLGEIAAGFRGIVASDGDRAPLLSRLGWRAETTTILSLEPLSARTVVELCAARGLSRTSPDLPAQLSRISRGEPLLLALLLDPVDRSLPGRLDLPAMAEGYEGYLEQRLGKQASSTALARVLALISQAFGPLGLVDIASLLRCSGENEETTSLVVALREARPTIVEWRGLYAFSHERLRRYFEARLSQEEKTWVDRAFLVYGTETLSALRERRLAVGDVSPYLLDHYRIHLLGSPEAHLAAMTLCTPEWLGAWMARPDGYLGFLSDVEAVRVLAAEHAETFEDEKSRSVALGEQIRCALIELSLRTLAMPPSVARVTHDHEIPPDSDLPSLEVGSEAPRPLGEESVDFERLVGDNAERAELLARLAGLISGVERDDVLSWAQEAAENSHDAGTLVAVARSARASRRALIARQAARMLGDDLGALHVALDIVTLLPESEAGALLRSSLARAEAFPDDVVAIVDHAATFEKAHVTLLWRWASALAEPARAAALARLAPRLPAGLRDEGLRMALDALIDLSSASADHHEISCALAALAPRLPEALFSRALELTRTIGADSVVQADGSSAMIPYVRRLASLGRTAEALEIAMALYSPEGRFRARAAVLPSLAERPRSELAAELVRELEADHLGARAAYIELSAGDLRRGVELREILRLARSTGRLRPLAALAEQLDGPDRELLVFELMVMARSTPECDAEQLLVLPRFARDMSPGDAAYLFGRLLAHLVVNTRSAFFTYWNGEDFRLLLPLLLRCGGEPAILAAAREIVSVAKWFP